MKEGGESWIRKLFHVHYILSRHHNQEQKVNFMAAACDAKRKENRRNKKTQVTLTP